MHGGPDSAQHLILGGPGTGKTSHLCRRVAELNSNANEGSILFLAFHGTTLQTTQVIMNKAGGRCLFATLPGLCLGLVSQHYSSMGFSSKPALIPNRERRAMMEEAVRAVNDRMFPTELGYELEVQKELTRQQLGSGQIGMLDLPKFVTQHLALPSLQSYFGQFQHILVDDGQELSSTEWHLLQKITGGSRTLTLAADLTSSVNHDTIARKLAQLTPSEVLTQSYRSKQWIVECFNQLQAFGVLHNPKTLTSTHESRIVSQNYHVLVEDLPAQLAWMTRQVSNCLQANPSVTVGVVVRGSAEGTSIADHFLRHGIPSQSLHLRNRFTQPPPLEARVLIGTPFDLKGTERTVILVPSMVEGQWPYFREDLAQARSNLLIAIGRAQSALFLLSPQKGPGGQAVRPSRFIREANTPEVIMHKK